MNIVKTMLDEITDTQYKKIGGRDFVEATLKLIDSEIYNEPSRKYEGYQEVYFICNNGVFSDDGIVGDFKNSERRDNYFYSNLSTFKEVLDQCVVDMYSIIANQTGYPVTKVYAVLNNKAKNKTIMKKIIDTVVMMICHEIVFRIIDKQQEKR